MAIKNNSASFPDWGAASKVLRAWRESGPSTAESILSDEIQVHPSGLLLQEIHHRLSRDQGPRLLIDGCWLSRPHGGITRVWQQILSTWQLPGLINAEAPVAVIDRKSHLSITSSLLSLEGQEVDPFDPEAVADLSEQNRSLVQQWKADVFCSSWISNSGSHRPSCAELALVHDCLPERIRPDQPEMMSLRRRWWQQAVVHLAVSSATAEDLAHFLQKPDLQLPWCHLAPAEAFHQTSDSPGVPSHWRCLKQKAGLPDEFVLLPATSAIGSYKNPELLAQALADRDLLSLPLLLCGIAAERRAQELEMNFPHLRGRVLAAGFSDSELALAYRQALAVVIPSRIEGFGLPAIEVMASGGLCLVADARGLREAGAEAALRFSPRQPEQLRDLLKLVADPVTRAWLQSKVQPRMHSRLARLNPDLIGLALLAQARRALAV
tara:strand:- start:501 stop:1811 length:1311 start_codon:yes stop_codon:yes gene_type:complete